MPNLKQATATATATATEVTATVAKVGDNSRKPTRQAAVVDLATAVHVAHGDYTAARFRVIAAMVLAIAEKAPGGLKAAGGKGKKSPFRSRVVRAWYGLAARAPISENQEKKIRTCFELATGITDGAWKLEGLREAASAPEATVDTVVDMLAEAGITKQQHLMDKRSGGAKPKAAKAAAKASKPSKGSGSSGGDETGGEGNRVASVLAVFSGMTDEERAEAMTGIIEAYPDLADVAMNAVVGDDMELAA